jgi:hypothetical protein
MPARGHRLSAILILVAFLALAIACGVVIPPFENLDEIEHFGAIRHVAETGRLPVHGTPAAETYHYRQEASQPPLYYLLSAGLVRLLGLEADQETATVRPNPWVTCGFGGASPYDNRTVFYHDPNREAFPWQGTYQMLHILRIGSTLLQAVTVGLTYLLARRAFPNRRWIAPIAMAVVAFNPQFLLVASGVNNDNLITPMAALALLLLLDMLREGLSLGRGIGLGVVIGLAGLSKLSGWFLLVLTALVVVVRLVRTERSRLQTTLSGAAIPLVALLVAGWWFWRNWQLYGDPTALRPMLELVGTRDGPAFSLQTANLMFRSFWGQLPCAFYPVAFYIPYAILSLLSLLGLVIGLPRLSADARWGAALMGGWFVTIVIGWMRWESTTPATGGRLLFPALPALATLIGLAISGLAQRRTPVASIVAIVSLALLAGWFTGVILPAFFAPPPRYEDARAVEPDHVLDATFGDDVRLLGYDASLVDQGRDLDVTLYWQAQAPMAKDYTLALQLVSPVPGDTTLRWNYNSWPGHGTYPTSAWLPRETIADGYRFSLPESDFPTQAWDLHLVLYATESGQPLPVRLYGDPAGERVILSRLRVPGEPPSCPPEGELAAGLRFGEAIGLTHALITPEEGGTQVALCWEALQSPAADYTVFVHLESVAGTLIATGDSPPMVGAFPTAMWQPGDVILDVHHLPEEIEDLEFPPVITLGLYRPEDGSRLPARIDGSPVPDDAVPIWPELP